MPILRHPVQIVCAVLVLGVPPVLADSIYASHAPGQFGEYEAGTSISVPMVRVPGIVAGAGAAYQYSPPDPNYDFYMGKYDITNTQYAAFLNDAQRDGGATGRGSNMVFQANGLVTIQNGTLFLPQNAAPTSRISYDALAPVGSRYTAQPGFANHPVVNVSWLGAVKFCNWLTIDQGKSPSERAYTEGPNYSDWHPVTISTANWTTRDLNNSERQALVTNYSGFRLPMDNLGVFWGLSSQPENGFNEWYKAAAYDPAAPDDLRAGLAQANVAPDHWRYGFGRDTLTGADANYAGSGDPFESIAGPHTTPVGFYDGLIYRPDGTPEPDQVFRPGDFRTNPNNNVYGIYDLSGDVWQWTQDYANGLMRASLHGGSWGNSSLFSVDRADAYLFLPSIGDGFRILQIPEPATACLLGLSCLVLRRRRTVRRWR